MKHHLIKGTAILTISSLLCRIIGFFYRIFLSQTIGAEGIGIFQLILPLYNLCLALTASGIQTALSRLIAAEFAKVKKYNALLYFFTGTCMAFILSTSLSIIIRVNAENLCTYYFKETRCLLLIQILSYSLPFSALHACLNGWFYGTKKVKIPAFVQILEEFIRLATTYIFYYLFLTKNIQITPMIAVFGFITSEFISVFITLCFLWQKEFFQSFSFNFYDCITSSKEILKTGFPLTLNRLLLNTLHSIEAVLIPFCLQKGHLSSSNALSSFGIITGMSLPIVLFPTAIINAMSTILLPAISEKHAKNNADSILTLVQKTTWYSFIIGIFFSILFFLFGCPIGSFLYQNQDAGNYIRLLSFICPFLFINITLASVMNGLGKTHLCLMVNFLDMIIRILTIYALVPSIHMSGYILGLVGGEFVCSFISIYIILHITKNYRFW